MADKKQNVTDHTKKYIKLFKEIIFHYHPQFKNLPESQAMALKWPNNYKVERLVEQSIAIAGGYRCTDSEHCDFSDGTEAKTASIRVNAVRPGLNSHTGEISNVQTAGGGQKEGGLRVVIYNPHQDQLLYYFLPKKFWKNHITIHPSSGIGKIMFTYHKLTGRIQKLEGYEKSSFLALARARK